MGRSLFKINQQTLGNTKLLVGTSKGLVVWEEKTSGWHIRDVHFLGMPANYVYVHPFSGEWWVSLAHGHWGQKLCYSSDEGRSWKAVAPPTYPADAEIRPGRPATLKKIWTIHHADPENDGAIWVGTEPGGLFYLAAPGRTFVLNESLWNHPSRSNEQQWFGAGRDLPFLHSIVVDPRDSSHLYIAVSCAGVFESRDGGNSWHPCNQGLIAAYLPNPRVEIGHDPHRLLICDTQPDVLWQQNHCGIFRSVNGGASWQDVSETEGIARYGFALAADPDNPDRAWVIPAISDEMRVAPDMALCVCRTEDGGQSWQALRNGLPQTFSFDIVFRHSLALDGERLAFGSTTGNLFFSADRGDHWQRLHTDLARIDCLCFG